MLFLHISHLEIINRQRKEIFAKELIELKRSILSKGLLHAPVVFHTQSTYRLIAGERRVKALKELHEEGFDIYYNNEKIPPHTIPYVLVGNLTLDNLQEAELEENILRAPLTWLEEAEARATIHNLRKEYSTNSNQPPPSLLSTAKYIAAKQGKDPSTITNKSPEYSLTHKAIAVAEHKNLPEVQVAKNLETAYKAVLDHNERQFKALLTQKSFSSKKDFTVIQGDCRKLLSSFQNNTFNIIFTDPPYGINADTIKHDSSHFYNDKPDNALEIIYSIISEGFRITKPKASLFIWCDIEHFLLIRQHAATNGWTPWRTPIIWYKGQSGKAPWGRAGFIRTYELLFYAVKGQKELFHPGGPDIIYNNKISNQDRQHAAEKPVDLIEYLLSRAALAGDHILDPCCGSGSIFKVGQNLKLKVTGIELDSNYYNLSLSTIGDLYNEESKEN